MVRLISYIISIFLVVSGCRPSYTTIQPKESDVIGTYTTSDTRAKGSILQITADRRFDLKGYPGKSGKGVWTIQRAEEINGWELALIFQEQGKGDFWQTGQRLRGAQKPYQIEFFLDDPDFPPVAFVRTKDESKE